MTKPELIHCSFCGKAQNEVEKLIAGPTSYICDECIKLCQMIVKDNSDNSNTPSNVTSEHKRLINAILHLPANAMPPAELSDDELLVWLKGRLQP